MRNTHKKLRKPPQGSTMGGLLQAYPVPLSGLTECQREAAVVDREHSVKLLDFQRENIQGGRSKMEVLERDMGHCSEKVGAK